MRGFVLLIKYKKLLEFITNMFYSHLRYAGVAQLVEHLIRNEGVVGSSPITGTRNKKRKQ